MTKPHPLIPVIIGPTAGGKSALAIACAHQLHRASGSPVAILSADSVQIFRHMDIGSAKPSLEEREGFEHLLIDLVEPEAEYTVHDWLNEANATIERLRTAGVLPIIVGGTHLYIKSLVDGLFSGPEPDPALRAQLNERPLPDLRRSLEAADPHAAARIHPADRRRTVRALEVFLQTGTPISQLQQQWDKEKPQRSDLLLIALDWPTEAINRRINQRVRDMMTAGLLEEVSRLAPRLGPQARAALGYSQLLHHLEGGCSLDDAIERIKIETRRFAKNQRTWLKRLAIYPQFEWMAHEQISELGVKSLVQKSLFRDV